MGVIQGPRDNKWFTKINMQTMYLCFPDTKKGGDAASVLKQLKEQHEIS